MMDNENNVFAALAHENRRILLDALFERDGQTVNELCAVLPDITRFGCMKHLQVLEDAGLIATRKAGREKRHYLNPVPIQMVYDRWVTKFAQPVTRKMTGLKYLLEESQMTSVQHVYEILIRTTPEKLWQAMTDGSLTEQYYYQTRVESTWTPGAAINYYYADGGVAATGEVLQHEPPQRLVMTFKPMWYGDDAGYVTRMTWQIEPMDGVCKLVVTTDDLQPNTAQMADFASGMAVILSGLKTLMETGQPLFAASPA
jgi:uncharacterized protein YndB with AHSA1/START domain